MYASRLFSFIVLGMFLGSAPAARQSFELVTFDTEDGGRIEAAWFEAAAGKAVILAHGAVFNKESWYFLAQALQQRGVSALAIDFRGYGNSQAGSSPQKLYDVLGAVAHLRRQGIGDIGIVGASMGGAAVLAALAHESAPVGKVVLLAPAGGAPLASASVDKLFVVSRGEGMYGRVMEIYEASAEPKSIAVYPGEAHAQHLFNTDERDDLVEQIVGFVVGAL